MTPHVAAPRSRDRELGVVALGVALGFALSRIGFTDFTAVQQMLTLSDFHLFFVFAGGVALTAIGLLAVRRWKRVGEKPFEKRVVIGGVVFGVGWAVAGACPGVAFAQLGEGKLWALATVAGILVGTAIMQRRASSTRC